VRLQHSLPKKKVKTNNILLSRRLQACQTNCFTTFPVQAFHTDSRFTSNVRFRYATSYEAGLYYCVPGLGSQALVWNSQRCPTTTMTAAAPSGASGTTVSGTDVLSSMSIDTSGNIKFPVYKAGAYQATLVAYCSGCGASGNVTVDFLIRVIDSSDNPNPPSRTFNSDPTVAVGGVNNGITGVSPASTPSSPYVVECAASLFYVPSGSSGPATLSRLRVGYKDPDDKTTVCRNSPQNILWIQPITDMPPGVAMSALQDQTTGSSPSGASYIDITWTPQCEDLSQIGFFAFCFAALDNANVLAGGNFHPLPPLPSPNNCVFILVKPPPAINPSPNYLTPPTLYTTCSQSCCGCCGQPSCACQAVADAANGNPALGGCCFNTLGLVGLAKVITVEAQDGNLGKVLNLSISADSSSVAGVPSPTVSSIKYGCDPSGTFSSCTSDATKRYMVSAQVTWNLSAVGSISSQRGVPPIKVCYQAQQLVSSAVNVAKWVSVYGHTPNNDSCTVCLTLAIKAPPFFVDTAASGLAWASPPEGTAFVARYGRPIAFNITAGSSSISQRVSVVLVADPGAPNGMYIADPQFILVSSLNLYLTVRTVTFSPSPGQLGSTYPVRGNVLGPNFSVHRP